MPQACAGKYSQMCLSDHNLKTRDQQAVESDLNGNVISTIVSSLFIVWFLSFPLSQRPGSPRQNSLN